MAQVCAAVKFAEVDCDSPHHVVFLHLHCSGGSNLLLRILILPPSYATGPSVVYVSKGLDKNMVSHSGRSQKGADDLFIKCSPAAERYLIHADEFVPQ